MDAKELEKLSEKIHKLYCEQYLKDNDEPYWTHGDYSKLDEKTKEYDRNIARFINKYTNAKLSKIAKKIENQKEKIAPCESDEEMWNDGLDRAIDIIKKEIK